MRIFHWKPNYRQNKLWPDPNPGSDLYIYAVCPSSKNLHIKSLAKNVKQEIKHQTVMLSELTDSGTVCSSYVYYLHFCNLISHARSTNNLLHQYGKCQCE